MAKKACKVTLRKPIGINNYQGKSFRCFARGDTLPFFFRFTYENGERVDVTGWRCVIAFATNLSCNHPGCNNDNALLEVEIPVVNPLRGTFAGNVENDQTKHIPCGLVYATIKYVTAPHVDPVTGDKYPGLSYILDMCQLEVYPSVAPSS